MNQIVYEQFELDLKKKNVCLCSKKVNLKFSLGFSIKRIEIKHNNLLVNMILDLTYIILYFYVYTCLK